MRNSKRLQTYESLSKQLVYLHAYKISEQFQNMESDEN